MGDTLKKRALEARIPKSVDRCMKCAELYVHCRAHAEALLEMGCCATALAVIDLSEESLTCQEPCVVRRRYAEIRGQAAYLAQVATAKVDAATDAIPYRPYRKEEEK